MQIEKLGQLFSLGDRAESPTAFHPRGTINLPPLAVVTARIFRTNRRRGTSPSGLSAGADKYAVIRPKTMIFTEIQHAPAGQLPARPQGAPAKIRFADLGLWCTLWVSIVAGL